MKILFPSEPFSPKQVDSAFKAEYEAAKLVGFEIFLYDHDELVKSGHFISNLPYNHGPLEIIAGDQVTRSIAQNNEPILFRGWMLKVEYYGCLVVSLIEKNYKLINDVENYWNAHYFTHAYPVIKDHTSKAWWTGDWDKMVDTETVDWKSVRDYLGGDVIIKDYVKSEKGNSDLFILKKELSNEEFYNKILQFIEARGKLFNRGIVFKQIEQLKKYDGVTNEWRIFFVNNKPINFGFNSEKLCKTSQPPFETLVTFWELGKSVKSNFFTMDIAEKEDGSWMILELGDGQVSGLPAAEEPIKFYNNLYTVLNGGEI
jgi:hypothetical protein